MNTLLSLLLGTETTYQIRTKAKVQENSQALLIKNQGSNAQLRKLQKFFGQNPDKWIISALEKAGAIFIDVPGGRLVIGLPEPYQIAQRAELEMRHYKKRDGQDWIHQKYNCSELFNVDYLLQKLGDNYNTPSSIEEEQAIFIDLLAQAADQERFTMEHKELIGYMKAASPNETIITENGLYYDTVPDKMHRILYDVYEEIIGIFIPDQQEEE